MSSWRRETLRLYLRYLISGMASVPAGVAYAYLKTSGSAGRFGTSATLAAAFASAIIAWWFSERLLPVKSNQQVAAQAYSEGTYGFGLRVAGAAMAVSIFAATSQHVSILASSADTMEGATPAPPSLIVSR
jgi:hypothetical protein